MSADAGRRFEGRVAIVTGASRGIGPAIARRLVHEGARVAITARDPTTLAEAAATMPEGRPPPPELACTA